MRRFPRDLRHVLDGAGACSDGRDPFTRSRFRVIPARRVEPAAAESLSAGDIGDVGDIEHAHRGDDGVELSRDTVLGLELPAALGVRPPQGRDAGARDEVAAELIVGGDLLQVAEDLRLVGEGLAPSRVQRERIGVEVRWHIACGAGIGVVAPGAAEPLTAVEDREVVSAVGELNPHRDAARACADDRDLGFDTRHLCNHYIYSVMRNGAFFRPIVEDGPALTPGAAGIGPQCERREDRRQRQRPQNGREHRMVQRQLSAFRRRSTVAP